MKVQIIHMINKNILNFFFLKTIGPKMLKLEKDLLFFSLKNHCLPLLNPFTPERSKNHCQKSFHLVLSCASFFQLVPLVSFLHHLYQNTPLQGVLVSSPLFFFFHGRLMEVVGFLKGIWSQFWSNSFFCFYYLQCLGKNLKQRVHC